MMIKMTQNNKDCECDCECEDNICECEGCECDHQINQKDLNKEYIYSMYEEGEDI